MHVSVSMKRTKKNSKIECTALVTRLTHSREKMKSWIEKTLSSRNKLTLLLPRRIEQFNSTRRFLILTGPLRRIRPAPAPACISQHLVASFGAVFPHRSRTPRRTDTGTAVLRRIYVSVPCGFGRLLREAICRVPKDRSCCGIAGTCRGLARARQIG